MKDNNCNIIKSNLDFLQSVVKVIVEKKSHPWQMFYDNKLIDKLSKIERELSYCDGQCLQCPTCLDIIFTHKAFSNFCINVHELYKDFVNVLSSENITEEQFGQVLNNYITRFLKQKNITNLSLDNILKKANCPETISESLVNIHSRVIEQIESLNINLSTYSKCEEQDIIISETLNIGNEEYCVAPANLYEDNVIVYFDMNAYDDLFKIQLYRMLIENLKNDKYIFVYSPYIVEEILKYNDKKWQDDFIDQVSSITDDHILLKSQPDEHIVVVCESPIYSKKRTNDYYTNMTYAAQSLEEKDFQLASIEFWNNKPKGYSVPDDLDTYYLQNKDNEIGEYINRAYCTAFLLSAFEYPEDPQELSYKEQENFI